MAKQKTKSLYTPLVVTGYALFALLLINTALTMIPFGIMAFDPRVIRENVLFFFVLLSVGAILPVLVGYFIGDHAVKSKSKLSHHFSGVLFGLLAYWVMSLPTLYLILPPSLFADNYKALAVAANIIPSIGVAIMTTLLAVAHVRSKQAKHDLIEYKPFAIVLLAAIALTVGLSIGNNILTHSVGFYTFFSPGLIAVFGIISYLTLRKSKLKPFAKVTWSAVSVSVLFAALYVSYQFVYTISSYIQKYPTEQSQNTDTLICYILALAGWMAYWTIQVKALSKAKK